MTIGQALLAEWKHEATSTRKMLAQVPADKFEWQPHAKSMTLGHLAMHIPFSISVFAPAIFDHTRYEWAGNMPSEPMSTQDLLESFDEANLLVQKYLEVAKDEDFSVLWSFGPKGKPAVMSLPRIAAVRGLIFNHIIHHRGQLSVYLRLLDIPVPGMYGPSADEK